MNKDDETKVLRTVKNEKTGDMVPITRDFIEEFSNHEKGFLLGTLKMAWHLSQIMDKQLYLAGDYGSFKEYADVRLHISYDHAKKYVKIGRSFGPVFFEGLPVTPQNRTLNDSNKDNENKQSGDGQVQNLNELGMRKLYNLTKIPDADFKEIVSKGVISLPDGGEWSLEDYKNETNRRAEARIREIRQEYSAELTKAEAELGRMEKERDDALKAADATASQAEAGLKYSALYEQKNETFQTYQARLNLAHTKAQELNQVLKTIKNLPAEFEALVQGLQDLHRQMDRMQDNLKQDNLDSGAFTTLSYPHPEPNNN